MKPLSKTKAGETHHIKWMFGEKNVVDFLKSIGAEVGTKIHVIDNSKSDVLVKINGHRIAIDGESASRIQV